MFYRKCTLHCDCVNGKAKREFTLCSCDALRPLSVMCNPSSRFLWYKMHEYKAWRTTKRYSRKVFKDVVRTFTLT
jgi:hypothetical protein